MATPDTKVPSYILKSLLSSAHFESVKQELRQIPEIPEEIETSILKDSGQFTLGEQYDIENKKKPSPFRNKPANDTWRDRLRNAPPYPPLIDPKTHGKSGSHDDESNSPYAAEAVHVPEDIVKNLSSAIKNLFPVRFRIPYICDAWLFLPTCTLWRTQA
jgi:hypothetical protein